MNLVNIDVGLQCDYYYLRTDDEAVYIYICPPRCFGYTFLFRCATCHVFVCIRRILQRSTFVCYSSSIKLSTSEKKNSIMNTMWIHMIFRLCPSSCFQCLLLLNTCIYTYIHKYICIHFNHFNDCVHFLCRKKINNENQIC